MALYESIGSSYDVLFPLKQPRIAYARELAERGGGPVLDIGCATGALALELARLGFAVTGVDLDREMIGIARERARERALEARFGVVDMREIGARFGASSLGTILCLGNTIVHLPEVDAIGAFLSEAGSLLMPRGRLAVQLVNYDRVISGELTGLPTLENERVRFTRGYRYDAPSRRVLFRTELTQKGSGECLRDETPLTPLTHAELERMIPACGLALEATHADFSGRPFGPADDSFVALLRPLAR